MNAYTTCLKKYAVFSGRASRREYWGFIFINLVIMILLSLLFTRRYFYSGYHGGYPQFSASGIPLLLYSVATYIPGLAVTVRRLHDTGRSGFWYFIQLIPFIGELVMFIFMLLPSSPYENEYGLEPGRERVYD